ncbi:MAG: hypothetical protein WDN02_07535 [Methylovirgula sp.]|uniref:hypothetical protein n=1 Tax=Methylovirgula sp. TaxID=1978224 RepID=UPI0030762F57
MRRESHDADRISTRARGGNERRMTAVNAVETAENQRSAAWRIAQVSKLTKNAHAISNKNRLTCLPHW